MDGGWKLSAQGIVSLLVVLLFGAVLILLIMRPVTIDGMMKDVLMIMLGALGTNFTSVVGFYIGSSSSSHKKDDTISQMATGTGPGTPTPVV